MKKILSLLFIFGALFALAGCNGSDLGEFPSFNERNVVELSAEEMVTLFSNLEYTTTSSESVRMTAKGHFKVTDESSWTWGTETTSYVSVTEMTFDVVVYGLVSEQVTDVRLHAKGTADVKVDQEERQNNVLVESSSMQVSGSAALYFINQSLYFDVDGTQTQEGETTDAVFKQKLNQSITQQQWASVYNDAVVENPDEMLPIPQELLDMLEDGDFQEIMDALPGLKVYKDGQTHSVLFELTKDSLLSSVENVIRAVATQMTPQPSEAEIQEQIDEAIAQINAEVEAMTFRYAITIKDNKITKMAVDVEFVSKDGKIDIDILVVYDFNVTLPAFPSDLDTYVAVSYPGEGIFD